MKEMLSSKNGEKKGVREALTDPTVTVCRGRQLWPAPRNVQSAEWQQGLLHFLSFPVWKTLEFPGIIPEPSWHCAKLDIFG